MNPDIFNSMSSAMSDLSTQLGTNIGKALSSMANTNTTNLIDVLESDYISNHRDLSDQDRITIYYNIKNVMKHSLELTHPESKDYIRKALLAGQKEVNKINHHEISKKWDTLRSHINTGNVLLRWHKRLSAINHDINLIHTHGADMYYQFDYNTVVLMDSSIITNLEYLKWHNLMNLIDEYFKLPADK